MKHTTVILSIALPLIAAGLLVSQIFFTNNLAQDGSTLREISEKVEALTDENAKLEQQIASASSLLTIQKKAEERGFVPAKQFLTIAEGQYLVALNQKR